MNKMDIKEFVDEGFLQEANRIFFHPLGLSLAVDIDDEGIYSIVGIDDQRQLSKGIFFKPGVIDQVKIDNVMNLRDSKREERQRFMGEVIQHISFKV